MSAETSKTRIFSDIIKSIICQIKNIHDKYIKKLMISTNSRPTTKHRVRYDQPPLNHPLQSMTWRAQSFFDPLHLLCLAIDWSMDHPSIHLSDLSLHSAIHPSEEQIICDGTCDDTLHHSQTSFKSHRKQSQKPTKGTTKRLHGSGNYGICYSYSLARQFL